MLDVTSNVPFVPVYVLLQLLFQLVNLLFHLVKLVKPLEDLP